MRMWVKPKRMAALVGLTIVTYCDKLFFGLVMNGMKKSAPVIGGALSIL